MLGSYCGCCRWRLARVRVGVGVLLCLPGQVVSGVDANMAKGIHRSAQNLFDDKLTVRPGDRIWSMGHDVFESAWEHQRECSACPS